MKIADFFVQLGIKGDDKTKKGLKETKEGIGELKSMSIEAKAAIVGALYALEKWMSDSAKSGTNLKNFASITGQSAVELQKWQYAARQVGVANEEVEGSFKSVQQAMTNMLLGKGAPEGMAMLANKVGFDPNKARDTFYVLEQLQKFAKEVPEDVGNAMIRSFGVSDNMIAAMRRNAFRPEVMRKAPIYSEGEMSQLNKVDVAWSNIWKKFEMGVGHLNAKHGMSILKDIESATNALLKLVDALAFVVEKLKLIQVLGKVFEGWSMIFEGLGSVMKDAFGSENIKSIKEWKGLDKDPVSMLSDWIGNKMFGESSISPPAKQNPVENKTQNINVNQNLNFQHDGKDAKKTGSSVNKAVKDAYRQLSAQSQGS